MYSTEEPLTGDPLVVLGPTASGKTRLAVQLATSVGAEIISADSRQLYRGMDIGTGKDLGEYGDIRAHLIDIREPGDEYHLFAWQRDCAAAIADIRHRRRVPLIAGGTGLYIQSILQRYELGTVPPDPELRARLEEYTDDELRAWLLEIAPQQHNSTDLANRKRLERALEIAIGTHEGRAEIVQIPALAPLIFCLHWPTQELRERIRQRLRQRLDEGMIHEAHRLHEAGLSLEQMAWYGLEYAHLARYLASAQRAEDLAALEEQLWYDICRYAKRQRTWFRRMERQGIRLHWLDATEDPLQQALDLLGKEAAHLL